jgi:hypothetical protein
VAGERAQVEPGKVRSAPAREVIQFRLDVLEADFLFGTDVREYIKEVGTRASDLYVANAEVRDPSGPVPKGYDHQKALDTMHERQYWFADQHEVAFKKFSVYLDVSQ